MKIARMDFAVGGMKMHLAGLVTNALIVLALGVRAWEKICMSMNVACKPLAVAGKKKKLAVMDVGHKWGRSTIG